MTKVVFFTYLKPELAQLVTAHAPAGFDVGIHPIDLADEEKAGERLRRTAEKKKNAEKKKLAEGTDPKKFVIGSSGLSSPEKPKPKPRADDEEEERYEID